MSDSDDLEHVLITPRVRALRRERGLTQRELAELSGVSLRTVKTAEGSGRVGVATLRKLAEALDVETSRIAPAVEAADEVPRFALQQVLPVKTSAPIARTIRRGAVEDMNSQFESAISRFRAALKKAASTGDFNQTAQLTVKLATTLDNAGDHERAVRTLERVLADAESSPRKILMPGIANWVRYHIGLGYRRWAEVTTRRSGDREQRLRCAEREFVRLRRIAARRQATAATHQLGVVHLIRASEAASARPRSRHLAAAVLLFRNSARAWRQDQNFREGYSLRRLAEIAEFAGDGREACERLLDALELFAHHDCHRYRDEVRAHLRRLYETPRRPARRTRRR